MSIKKRPICVHFLNIRIESKECDLDAMED